MEQVFQLSPAEWRYLSRCKQFLENTNGLFDPLALILPWHDCPFFVQEIGWLESDSAMSTFTSCNKFVALLRRFREEFGSWMISRR